MTQSLANSLFENKIVKNSGVSPTHTKIGDKDLNIYPGSYHISDDKLSTFHQSYYNEVFVNNKMEYLTEKQSGLTTHVDLDFRYNWDVDTRQHDKQIVEEIVFCYLDNLKKIFVFNEDINFDVFVMEKPNVNRLEDKTLTKDGIHITIGLQMDARYQLHLRKLVMDEVQKKIDLPLINSWDSVFDEGISRLTTNWQMFGSRKPGNEAYKLVYHYSITGYDPNDKEFSIEDTDNPEITFELFQKLSTHYTQNSKLEYKFDIPLKKTTKKEPVVCIKQTSEIDDNTGLIQLNYFLDNGFLEVIKSKKSHEDFTKIGYAIYNNYALKGLDIYLKMAEYHSDNYDIGIYTDRYNEVISKTNSNISFGSIYFIFEKFDKELYSKLMKSYRLIRLETNENSTENFMEDTLFSQTDYDLAVVLHSMYKDTYKCVDKEKRRWYYFNSVVWVEDKGITLRTKISVEMVNKYGFLYDKISEQMDTLDKQADLYELFKKKQKCISDICVKLKRTNDKNNIIRESMDLFYDSEFNDNIDNKPYLFAFKNCVFDLKTGLKKIPDPNDFLTITCGYDYDDNYDPNLIVELNKIIATILFNKEVKDYYMGVLATGLCGVTLQKFHICTGTGGNGKSILNSLALDCYGKYGYKLKPAVLQEEIKTGANPEVANLHKKRFVVSQEPDKNKRLKSSTIKELTGDKDINARGLYSGNTETKLNLTLIMECNEMPQIDETTGGVGRRVIAVPFVLNALEEKEYNNLSIEDKASGKYALQNTEYITDEFRTKYKQALFMILLSYFKIFVENNFNIQSAPKACLNKTKDYMATSDDIFSWFESYYEPLSTEELNTNVDIPISLTSIYSLFSTSDVFRNMTKEQKRSYNRKNFLEKIENNLFLRKHVIYKGSYHNKIQIKSDSIYNWKTIKTEE
jgi:hypothetical protein